MFISLVIFLGFTTMITFILVEVVAMIFLCGQMTSCSISKIDGHIIRN